MFPCVGQLSFGVTIPAQLRSCLGLYGQYIINAEKLHMIEVDVEIIGA